MFWSDVRWTTAALTAIAALPGSGAAETLVVRSAGPSAPAYPPGKAIADDARIVLRTNDQVVLLDGRGTRTLRGPGTFSPLARNSAAADTQSTFTALVAQHSQRRARIGAVRGASSAEPVRSPNIWFVDIDRSSTICVADPSAVTMWRSVTPRPATVTITAVRPGIARARSETVRWPTDRATMPWPATVPIATGAQYSISYPGAARPAQVRFAVLPPGGQGLEDLAAALIRNDCTAQLNLLIETVAIPQAASGGG